MIVIVGMILGAAMGWRNAAKRGGNSMDKAQYAGVGVIAGGLLGLFVTIGVEKVL
ncbi:MAG: apolipoprotein acyltransferase [Rhodobacteraceae bacterium]|jgi:hypothetical protein|nr:apolipoprotein acyltransferase [Paracoccaceae bacterium]